MPDFNKLYRLVEQLRNEEIAVDEIFNQGFTKHDLLRLAAELPHTELIHEEIDGEEDKAKAGQVIHGLCGIKKTSAIRALRKGPDVFSREEIIDVGFNLDDINAALQPDIKVDDINMSQNPVQNILSLLQLAPNTTAAELEALGFAKRHIQFASPELVIHDPNKGNVFDEDKEENPIKQEKSKLSPEQIDRQTRAIETLLEMKIGSTRIAQP